MFSLLVCKAKSLEHKVIFIVSLVAEKSEPHCNKQRKIAGQHAFFLKCPSTTSPAAFKLCDGFFVCWAFVGVPVLLFALIPGRLKNQAYGLESWVLCYANRQSPSVSIASLFLATKATQSISEQQTHSRN